MSSTTQRSKEWRPFRRRPKNKTFFCAHQKKNRRERDTTEKEKSPNCLMYHYKKRGFKEKKGYHTTHEGLVFFFGRSEVVSLFVLRRSFSSDVIIGRAFSLSRKRTTESSS